MLDENGTLVIGVLALQGAFEEHEAMIRQCTVDNFKLETRQVRTVADCRGLHGLILPGGESTAMGLIGNHGQGHEKTMWQQLQEMTHGGNSNGDENDVKIIPVWGTCAGMILLAEKCIGTSSVHQQALIGGMNITVCRNYFGSQISSFEMPVNPPPQSTETPYGGVFIRAPAILSVDDDSVQVLGTVVAAPCSAAVLALQQYDRENGINQSSENRTSTEARTVICAVRQGGILCTAFHPELTKDIRWHEYFVQQMVYPHAVASSKVLKDETDLPEVLKAKTEGLNSSMHPGC
jgi:pyridoxal 5'-phosphate synthase pdxT subunit